ncbi:MAG: hypothetical protein ACRCYQ_15140 [Nocardioides sp.]
MTSREHPDGPDRPIHPPRWPALVVGTVGFVVMGAVASVFWTYPLSRWAGTAAGDSRTGQILLGWLPWGGCLLAWAGYAYYRVTAWLAERRVSRWFVAPATVLVSCWTLLGAATMVASPPRGSSAVRGPDGTDLTVVEAIAAGGPHFAFVVTWMAPAWIVTAPLFAAALAWWYFRGSPRAKPPRPSPALLLALVLGVPPLLVLVLFLAVA